jgi:hypothetical protein
MYKGMAAVLGGLAQQVAQLALDNKNQAHTIATLQQELRYSFSPPISLSILV